MADPAAPVSPTDTSRAAAVSTAVWRLLIGQPLRFDEAEKEQITPVEGLPALSLDALTSVAYGPEAILIVLATAGAAALHNIFPITVAIVVLLGLLVFSYRQVIDAYPGGGGSYAVSKANLGAGASKLAAASLIVDYTLTVAVSIAAGVGALTSAYPSLRSLTVPLCLGILVLITVLNLRGLGEGARAFMLPTLLFIVGLLAVIAVGLIHPLDEHAVQQGRSLVSSTAEAVTVLLVLKSFAAGCSALTGVEAIANGVPLFRQPRVKRAKRTELLLGSILSVMLLGLAELAVRFHIGPRSSQTVLSQIMVASVGRNWAYYVVAISITVVLGLAANTSFGGLPVLLSLLARDNRLPHLLSMRGDRLVFSRGILLLSVMSGVLLLVVRGNTNSLIPLFAIGVFIGFTLAQSGLVVHWWRIRPPRWKARALLNGIGAMATGISTLVFLFAKFTEGAWVVVVAIPTFIGVFHMVERYYQQTGREMGLGEIPHPPRGRRTLVIVPVVNVSKLTSQALSKALSLGDEVVAVTVVFDDAQGGDEVPADGEPRWLAPGQAGYTGDGQSPEGRADGTAEPGAATAEPPAASDSGLPPGDRAAPESETPGHPPPDGVTAQEWQQWHCGVPLRVLHTPYASILRPLIGFVDEMRKAHPDDQIVVLIPVIIPRRLRERILHNHVDLALTMALRHRTDLVVARVPLSVDELART
jgi:amino acid transporter